MKNSINCSVEEITTSPLFSGKIEIIERISGPSDKNLSYKIEIEDEFFVLKIYDQADRESIIESLYAQKFFYNKRFLCQEILEVKGHLLFNQGDNYYAIFEFVEGNQIKDLSREDTFRILDILHLFHSIGEGYTGKVSFKESPIPPIEGGAYEQRSKEILKEYVSLNESVRGKNGVIYGDFHFDQVLKSEENRIFLLDFESIRLGDPLEDIANFIFYSECTQFGKEASSSDIISYLSGSSSNNMLDWTKLKHYMKKTALRYALGNIWEFNNNHINEATLQKRLRPLDNVDDIIL